MAFSNHVAPQCGTPTNSIPALATAPIQVASIVEHNSQMPVLAPATAANGHAHINMPHRHGRHGERYAPYPSPHSHASQHSSSTQNMPVPLQTSPGQTSHHYEQGQYMGGCNMMQQTPTSPQTLEPQSNGHYAQEDQSLKPSMAVDYAQFSPNRHFKARRHSEVPHTPDGMEQRVPMQYNDMAPSQSHPVNHSSAFMTPPPPSGSGTNMTAPPHTLHYNDSKASHNASTPHQYVAPHVMGYDKAEQGEAGPSSSPTTQLHPDSSLWQPMNSMADGYDHHVSAPVSNIPCAACVSGCIHLLLSLNGKKNCSVHDCRRGMCCNYGHRSRLIITSPGQ